MDIKEYIESPDALFHYTKVSTAIEHILHTKKFKLSVQKNSDDPREYKKLNYSMGEQEGVSIRKIAGKIDGILQNECRVMCFCTNEPTTLIQSDGSLKKEDAYSNGGKKSRMWTQYGQQHYGVCLVFSQKELKRVIDEQKQNIKHCLSDFVQYEQDGFNIDTYLNCRRASEEGVEDYSYNYVIENIKMFKFRKHVDYRDEAEFRVVVLDPERKLEYIDISSVIKCVIVGDRTSKVYFPLIKEICNKLEIETQKVSWHHGKSFLDKMPDG